MTVHLGFEVAGERYAVDVASVLEVTRLDAPTPVPGASPAILGVQSLRGRIIPMFDFMALMGVEGAIALDWAVIVEHGQLRAGLAVEAVRGVEQLPEQREPAESPVLENAAAADGELIGVVDLGALLGGLVAKAA